MKRPNIIFYFADQQRYDTLGCCGQPLNVTPNLDALAAQGVVFDNAFTCQPVCGPARACLQSGQYATQTGCFTNGLALDFSRKYLADYFHEAGYETAYVGKWHLATDRPTGVDYETRAVPPERRAGYRDYWMAADVLEFTSHGYNGYVFDGDGNRREFIGYRADCIANYAIDYLHRYTGERPFFLFLSQIEPHQQNDHDCFEGPDGGRRQFAQFTPPGDLLPGKGNWEKEYPDYLGCCHSLDSNLGRIVDTLRDKGLYDNTILIYTADHGCHFRTRNREYKRSCHDSSIHLPLVIAGPGFSGGRRVQEMVSLLDMPATLLDMAGIPVPESFQGRSICPLAAGKVPADWPEEVFLQISESQIGRALRTQKFKYSVRAEGDAWTRSSADIYYEDFLYDLEKDPFEQNNLAEAEEYAAVRAELSRRLVERMIQAGEQPPVIRPAREKPLCLQNDGYDYHHI